MKPVQWMVGGSVTSWLAAAALLGTRTSLEVLCGMIAPLVVATGTWMLTERTYRRNPEQLTSLLILAFGAKLVFFGTYVAVMLNVMSLRPVPFVAGFVGYFIALHLTEALYLRRLFAGGARASL
jgi:hypothetical protein